MNEAMKLETTDEALRNALAWYGEQARLARLIHSEGDPGRWALAEDGGKRAREVLALSSSPAGVGVAPADVYKVMKRYKDNGRFEWDFVSQMCRDIAARAISDKIGVKDE